MYCEDFVSMTAMMIPEDKMIQPPFAQNKPYHTLRSIKSQTAPPPPTPAIIIKVRTSN